MRRMTPITALVMLMAIGCGKQEEPVNVQALLTQRLELVESRIERLAEGIESCRASVRDVDKKLAEASFHVDQVPQLVRDVDAAKGQLAEASAVLELLGRRDDLLVLSGLIVADNQGQPRCVVSPAGLAILDASGRRVGAMEYDEAGRSMSASLQGHGTKSVALYAGQDRVAIGAYDNRRDGVVGWAATVTPEGQVKAGRAP